MLHHSFSQPNWLKAQKGIKVHLLIHDLEVLRHAHWPGVTTFKNTEFGCTFQEASFLKAADGIITHQPGDEICLGG